MRALLYSALVFGLTGLAGPLIRLATWPPDRFQAATSEAAASFVYNLVLDLWPTLDILAHAYLDVEGFLHLGALYVIGANVFLFALVGGLVSVVAHRRMIVALCYAMVCGLQSLFVLLVSGFNVRAVDWFALMTAMTILVLPFWLLARRLRHERGT